jgi:hypothetical protein
MDVQCYTEVGYKIMQYIGLIVIFLTSLGLFILFFLIRREQKRAQRRAISVIARPPEPIAEEVKQAVAAQHKAVTEFKVETERFNIGDIH